MAIDREGKVDAILSEDVARLIEELGIREEFERGEYHCRACNDVVNYENLKLVFPTEDREIGFICKKPECFVAFALRE